MKSEKAKLKNESFYEGIVADDSVEMSVRNGFNQSADIGATAAVLDSEDFLYGNIQEEKRGTLGKQPYKGSAESSMYLP
jgi:hypothetical protein